jgi:CheY-like chemotaxis protein
MSTRDTQRRRLTGRRVLVVENEYVVAMDVSDALLCDGAEVIGPAVSVTGAMDLVGAESPDAAVLDLSLYDGMIYPVVDALTARAVPIVFTTGYSCKDILEQYRHIPCLEKPVDPEEIIRVIADTAPPQLNSIRPA